MKTKKQILLLTCFFYLMSPIQTKAAISIPQKIQLVQGKIKAYFINKNITSSDLEVSAIEGMLGALNDPYSHYLSPQRVKKMRSRRTGTQIGIGIRLGRRNNRMVIISDYPNSTADKAGLRPLDHIIAIDQQSTDKLSLNEAYSLLRGEKGSTVVLTIRREAAAKPLEFVIQRNPYTIQAIEESAVFYDSIGYIKLNTFDDAKTPRFFKDVLRSLLHEQIKGLIIDLRGNGGGSLKNTLAITNYFIKEGPLIYIVDRNGKSKALNATGEAFCTKVPLFILVNEGTASAAEIFAAAIQEHSRGVLIGTATFGKASIQKTFTFKDRSILILTIAKYLTPSKKDIRGTGLEVNVYRPIPEDIRLEIEDPHYIYSMENDYQLQEALDYALLRVR
ncbi:hypothetical protein DID77_01890 [Candidatus Marinamargulisbacteria bacterium SCGC AG-439-L15]|nr:hypothetical protein DID77_01890 [Candidatus Marinamargulisbacteria bacterium SCGC AG-439-L15]